MVLSVSPSGWLRSSAIALVPGGYRVQRVTFTRTDGVRRPHPVMEGRGTPTALVATTGSNPRAYLLTGGGKVYSINPLTAQPSLHAISTPRGAPNTSAQIMFLDAAPVGDNLVVSSFFPRANGTTHAGIYLIDTTTWTARLLDLTTPNWFTTGDSLITFIPAGKFSRANPSAVLTKGIGIRIYGADGVLRYHLYGDRAFDEVEATPLFTAAIVNIPQPPLRGPSTPSRLRAWQNAATREEFLFNPITGATLGERTTHGTQGVLIGNKSHGRR
jgi:hypothetical protein